MKEKVFMEFRTEKDSLGTKKIPENVLWGIHTQRALENFNITRIKTNLSLIKAVATVKKAAVLTNQELGYIDEKKSKAIVFACEEIIDGKLDDEFPLDAFQGGAGTSTNMNVNEVIANRAIEILNGKRGDYGIINPIEHVNLHQSTNDVYPTALKIAAIYSLKKLSRNIAGLQGEFQRKEKEFAEIVKVGRTELQEAVPLTLGSEFSAFAEAIARDRWRTFKCEERIRTVNIGGTAIGTGISAPKTYIYNIIEKLRELTSLGLARGENVIDPTANTDSFVEVSGILNAHASNLIKISNDLRLMNLLGEIELPKLQVGSSIMPGKVNPVIPEAVIQCGLKIKANDSILFDACSRSTFQINEFMPLVAHALLDSLDILNNINSLFAGYVKGIKANKEKCEEYFNNSPAIVTAFIPFYGYDKMAEIVKEYAKTSKGDLRNFLEKKLGKKTVSKVLSPYSLVSLGYRDNKVRKKC